MKISLDLYRDVKNMSSNDEARQAVKSIEDDAYAEIYFQREVLAETIFHHAKLLSKSYSSLKMTFIDKIKDSSESVFEQAREKNIIRLMSVRFLGIDGSTLNYLVNAEIDLNRWINDLCSCEKPVFKP